jgi:hypothetical protein
MKSAESVAFRLGELESACFQGSTPNHALEPTAASGLRRLAVPSSLRSSAAAQHERSASCVV